MQWLSTLFEWAEGAVELRAFPNERGGGRTPSIFTRDAEDVARFVGQWDKPGYGVYFGVATRQADTSPPGRVETTHQLPAYWIDQDTAGKPVTLEALKGAYLPPSAIIDSGRGIHGYWILAEAEDVSAAQSNDHPAVEVLRALRRVFNSDPAVCDLARVMRLPGTQNSKYGGEPLPVQVLELNERRYSTQELQDWLAWQQALIGEPQDPFLAAAEKLGVCPALDVEQALATMKQGNIHERQLKISASLLTAGKSEDEIVDVLLPATRLAIGQEGQRWNWTKEEGAIRQMVRSGSRKFAPAPVIQLSQHRQEKVAPAAEPVAKGKGAMFEKVAKVALEAWGRPLAIIRGELWTYRGGVWEPVESEVERDLRAHIHKAARTLKAVEDKTLNGAWRWIYEDLDLFRRDVVWDRAGVIVGRNSALEVETGQLVPHSPDHYATRPIDCDITPAARCPIWLKLLADALPDDAERTVSTFQEWCGSALVRGKSRELTKGLFVYGPSYTGKSQLADVVRAMLGGNTVGLNVRAMSERFGMQPLLHAAGWIADDAVGRNETMNAEAYKVLITGESVSIERKNKENVETKFDLPVLLTMNSFPVVKDDSDAVYNRSLALEMRVVRKESEASVRPIGEVIIEQELAGVLNWAIEGWHRLRQRGQFAPPPAMVASLREFKNQNNPFQDFIDLCLEDDFDCMIKRDDLRDIFNTWLMREVQSKSKWSGKAISLALQQAMPKVKGDESTARVWVGLRFKPAAVDYQESEFGRERKELTDLNSGLTQAIRERHRPRPRTEF